MTREPTPTQPVLLRPHEPVAPRVVCTGDPGRSLRLAQALMEDVPRMLNHHRGLWGYTGPGLDGEPLTVQGTGIGGPSAAAVVAELVGLGAQRLVRVGTATGTTRGTVLAVTGALAGDGTSRALGAGEQVTPDPELTAPLAERADASGIVASADLLVRPGPDGEGGTRRATADAADLQTAAFLQAATVAGARAGAVLVIAADAGGRLDLEALHEAELRAGRLALAALL